jgi:cyclase
MTETTYSKGVAEVSPNCYAWMLPDGGWGWSNSGLIVGKGASMIVDTHFDLALTQEMLDGFAPYLTDAPLKTVFNTHANGDHYFGNQLIPQGVEIIATDAAAADMHQADVDRLEGLKHVDGSVGDYVRDIFGPFDFTTVTATGPTTSFSGEKVLDVGGREVVLYELGPAHTPGDAAAWVPDVKTAYAGDILFIGGTPIIWAGPVDNWIAACTRLLDLKADVYVPGHGPITDRAGVVAARDYLEFVRDETTSRFQKGMTIDETVADIDAHLGRFEDLGAKERLVQNVINIYGSLDPSAPERPLSDVFQAMAAMDGYPALAK